MENSPQQASFAASFSIVECGAGSLVDQVIFQELVSCYVKMYILENNLINDLTAGDIGDRTHESQQDGKCGVCIERSVKISNICPSVTIEGAGKKRFTTTAMGFYIGVWT